MSRFSFIDDRDLGRLEKIMQSYIAAIKSNTKATGKWTTGKSCGTLSTFINGGSDFLEIGIKSSDPILVKQLETGRKPGKMPPVDAIFQWSKDKGLSFKDDKVRRQFAFATAKKISKEGSKQYKAGRNENIYSNLYPKYKGFLVKGVNSALKTSIKLMINDILKK